jgi:hypothetical protein
MRSSLLLLLAACSSSHHVAPPPTCNVPDVEIGEGGRLVLEKTEGVELEGTGGLVVDGSGARWILRAPYGGDAGLRARCAGASSERAVRLRPMRWSLVSRWEENAGPPAREYFAMWQDEERLFVFGGFHYKPKQFTPASDLWELDLKSATWRPLEASGNVPLAPGGRVARAGAKSLYYFGGATIGEAGMETPPLLRSFDYEKLAWTDAPNAGGAPGSYTGAFVHDAKRGRWLSVCGVDASIGLHCDVHAYTPDKGFAKLAVEGTRPSGRYGFHYALDAERDRLIIHAGQTGTGNLHMSGDTWALELEPLRWVKLADTGDASPIRRNGAWALDEEGRRLFVWGGTSDGRTPVRGIQAFDLDQATWTSVETPEEVLPRASGMAVYDRANKRLLLGFGNAAKLYTDIWALSF